jgi:hypothetical protein
MFLRKNKGKLFMLFLLVGFTACDRSDDEVICTMEFRSITIQVNNRILDSFHTQREATGETYRFENWNVGTSNMYPVITDSLHGLLRNRSERFRFRGFSGGSMVVDEPLVLGGDACHVEYVSGRLSIDL